MQSENLNGVTGSDRARLEKMVITLAPALSCVMHVACLSRACVCVVGSQAWTPRVGGAMRVGPEASRVYSRQSVCHVLS